MNRTAAPDFRKLTGAVLRPLHLFSSDVQGLGWRTQLLIFLILVVAVISRRPDAVNHAQFFAEDGTFWYADAYNLGWLHALLVPHTGYYQTLPRLSAAFSLLFPLLFAPLVLNVVAIVIQVLPATFLLSSRCANWGTLGFRFLLAVAYIVLPNSRELDAAITEAQWHLALLAVLVVLAVPSSHKMWRLFDAAVIVLSGLTGPFCIALLPIAACAWWLRRGTWRLVLTGLVALCALAQFSALLTTAAATRSHEVLGATLTLFLRMLVGDVYLGAVVGQNHLAMNAPAPILIVAGVLGTALLLDCVLRAGLELRLFLVFAFVLYLASLHNPMISDTQPQWRVLAASPGLRYWFFPMLAFAWAAIWCLAQPRQRYLRVLAGAVLICMCAGILKDWKYPAFSGHQFRAYVQRFRDAPPGDAVVFPLYPDGWTMRLVKESTSCPASFVGVVDQPKDGSQVLNSVNVAGWVTAPVPLRGIFVDLDGVLQQAIEPNIARPDVDRKFPQNGLKNKGWQTKLDLSKAVAGPHIIEVHALLNDKCGMMLGSVTVEKIH